MLCICAAEIIKYSTYNKTSFALLLYKGGLIFCDCVIFEMAVLVE